MLVYLPGLLLWTRFSQNNVYEIPVTLYTWGWTCIGVLNDNILEEMFNNKQSTYFNFNRQDLHINVKWSSCTLRLTGKFWKIQIANFQAEINFQKNHRKYKIELKINIYKAIKYQGVIVLVYYFETRLCFIFSQIVHL